MCAGAAGACSASSQPFLASDTHCCVIFCRAAVTRGWFWRIPASRRRLLKERNDSLSSSMPDSSSCTRDCRLTIVVSFLFRYACCATRSCFRRLWIHRVSVNLLCSCLRCSEYPPRELADRPSQFVAGLSCEARALQSLLRPLRIAC